MTYSATISSQTFGSATVAAQELQRQENQSIAEGLKRQDPQLLDQLILRFQHRLLRYLLYLTNDRSLAEDLFQEVWMRVLVRGGQYNGKARFDTWLFTIARNMVIDFRRKRTTTSLDELIEGSGDDDRPFAHELSDNSPTPFEHCMSAEDRAIVAEALLKLDPIHREVLALRFHEELSLEEIAAVTRANLSTVKSRLYRGLASLRPHFAEASSLTPAETA